MEGNHCASCEESEQLTLSTSGTSNASKTSSHARASSRNPTSTKRIDSQVVVALNENKMREVVLEKLFPYFEIGIAAIDLMSPQLTLTQFVDTHSFLNTLTKLQSYEPVEVLLIFLTKLLDYCTKNNCFVRAEQNDSGCLL